MIIKFNKNICQILQQFARSTASRVPEIYSTFKIFIIDWRGFKVDLLFLSIGINLWYDNFRREYEKFYFEHRNCVRPKPRID